MVKTDPDVNGGTWTTISLVEGAGVALAGFARAVQFLIREFESLEWAKSESFAA